METTFDLHMVSPRYQGDVSVAIERGAPKLRRGIRDLVPLACGQLLNAISHDNYNTILHRDIKPTNMSLAAVGADADQEFTVAL